MNQIIKNMNKGIQELNEEKILELGNKLKNQNGTLILDKVIELTLIFCRELLIPKTFELALNKPSEVRAIFKNLLVKN